MSTKTKNMAISTKTKKVATIKKTKIDGYFFMSICNGELDVNCSGDENVLAAAFATILLDETKEGKQAKQLLTTAGAISAHELQSKEKYSSKTAKKVAKPVKKAANKK